jgi:cytidyltransferase-like protein
MLHSGHVRFLEEAASYGELFVGIGSDETVKQLKGRYPVTTQEERKYLVDALKYVKESYINRGTGIMDFVEELKEVKPHLLVVNNDGNTLAKQKLCEELGIGYLVLRRAPRENLPSRSTSSLRRECHIPYRIDLAGGWLDQPFVSKLCGGPVLTISIEPILEFNERSGMASSSRKRAIELWQTDLPGGDPEKLAKVLFAYENPPGTSEFSGSQDALGIVMPGLNRLDYNGSYWPESITKIHDNEILSWLERHLFLVTLGPRKSEFHVLADTRVSSSGAEALSLAARNCWEAINKMDVREFGKALRQSFEAQINMFPKMVNEEILAAIKQHESDALGWKLSGAGGGGYIILVCDHDLPGTTKIKIRRNHV